MQRYGHIRTVLLLDLCQLNLKVIVILLVHTLFLDVIREISDEGLRSHCSIQETTGSSFEFRVDKSFVGHLVEII